METHRLAKKGTAAMETQYNRSVSQLNMTQIQTTVTHSDAVGKSNQVLFVSTKKKMSKWVICTVENLVDLYKEDVQWDVFYLLVSGFLKLCGKILCKKWLNGGLCMKNQPFNSSEIPENQKFSSILLRI